MSTLPGHPHPPKAPTEASWSHPCLRSEIHAGQPGHAAPQEMLPAVPGPTPPGPLTPEALLPIRLVVFWPLPLSWAAPRRGQGPPFLETP